MYSDCEEHVIFLANDYWLGKLPYVCTTCNAVSFSRYSQNECICGLLARMNPNGEQLCQT